MQGQQLDLVILVGPLQLRRFDNSSPTRVSQYCTHWWKECESSTSWPSGARGLENGSSGGQGSVQSPSTPPAPLPNPTPWGGPPGAQGHVGPGVSAHSETLPPPPECPWCLPGGSCCLPGGVPTPGSHPPWLPSHPQERPVAPSPELPRCHCHPNTPSASPPRSASPGAPAAPRTDTLPQPRGARHPRGPRAPGRACTARPHRAAPRFPQVPQHRPPQGRIFQSRGVRVPRVLHPTHCRVPASRFPPRPLAPPLPAHPAPTQPALLPALAGLWPAGTAIGGCATGGRRDWP